MRKQKATRKNFKIYAETGKGSKYDFTVEKDVLNVHRKNRHDLDMRVASLSEMVNRTGSLVDTFELKFDSTPKNVLWVEKHTEIVMKQKAHDEQI